MNTDIYLDIPIGLNIIIIIIIIITIIIIALCEMKTFVISLNYNIVYTHINIHTRILLCLRRKEGSVLFNKALNTFSYSYMASDIILW